LIRSSALKLRRLCKTAEFAVALGATAARAAAPHSVALATIALGAAALWGPAPCLATEPGADTPAAALSGTAGSAGAAVFANRCAVCHGPQAAGIPGTFPSLHEQIVAFAKIPQGRDYLVMVVTTGLMGNLKVGGVNYNGVMPAQSGLGEAEVAAVLNYLASDLSKNESGTAALSAADVTDARARHADKSAQATRALRPATDL
jgi:mono/diheme cytochrome c family protein